MRTERDPRPVTTHHAPERKTSLRALLSASVATLLLFGAPALSENLPFEPPEPLHVEHLPNEQPFAIVHFTNFEGTRTDFYTVETEHGPVVVQVVMTLNRSGSLVDGGRVICCDDELHVVDTPAGVIADPWSSKVPEGENGEIALYLYLGS